MAKQTRSPARDALASAIQMRDIAAQEAKRAADALRVFDEQLGETRGIWYHAGEATKAAKERRQDLLRMYAGNARGIALAAASAGEVHPDTAVDNAIKAEALADEAYDAGKAGHRTYLTAAAIADDDLARAKRIVVEAAEAVRHDHVAAALAQCRASGERFCKERAVLRHLAHGLDGYVSNWSSATGIGPSVRTYLASPLDGDVPPEWLAAGEALLTNPDAVLPEMSI